MGDTNIFKGLSSVGFIDKTVDRDLERQRAQERNDAHQLAFHAVAYKQMPDDIRTTAKSWNMEAYFEVLWMNAFECGYKQAMRDAKPEEAER